GPGAAGGLAPALGALLVTGALSATPGVAQSRIHAELDTARATVGDRITLTVTVGHPSGSRVVWPDSLNLAPFEVLGARAGGPAAGGEGLRSTAAFTLTAFELGDLEVPSVDVVVAGPGEARDTLSTQPVGVRVLSVGADESGDIRDIRGPLSIPLSLLRVGLWVLLALATTAGGWLLWRRMRGRRQRPAAAALPASPPRPPHEVALEALAGVEASPLLERGQVKEYHIRVSDILREYVEARYRVGALEMTTGEVLEGLRGAAVDEPFLDGLRRFLEPCDLVKFAKVRPGAEASRKVLALGRHLVESSIPEPAPDEEPAPPDGLPAPAGEVA
ncbi:MAG TPA: hypothetical protein VE173_01915, partial [Longimicrobiales bacterium]|nr:hypothetical protein [Longimicrobiales bacterium]